MDRIRSKAASARNRVAEATSSGRGSASLSVPHASLPPGDNASTTAVNEGVLGPRPQAGTTAARDFAAPSDQPTHQPVLEPPTSLQSSVDAGQPVPAPAAGSSRPTSSGPSQDASRLQVPSGRPRANSAPQRRGQNARPAMGLRQPSIGIRREDEPGLRKVVSNDPLAAASASRLPALDETCEVHHTAADRADAASPSPSDVPSSTQEPKAGRLRRLSSAAQAKLGFGNKDKDLEHVRDPTGTAVAGAQYRDYAPSFVDVLDTVDPEVQTITSLTNVQNSLFVPNLGRWVNRRPTYTLRRPPSESQSLEEINKILEPARQAQQEQEAGKELPPRLARSDSETTMATLATIDSHLSDSRYAVLPHGTSLDGWSKEDKKELNDHVRHMLHSRRSKFKRSMRGFGQYVKRPLGFLVTLYATLITLFGLAWVLFLIGWINVGGRKDYIVNVIDNVLVALFAVVGDGLIPFRIVDTYHMIYIAHYHHYTWSRRKKDMLPELTDHNDLPTSNVPMGALRAPADPDDPEKGPNFEFTVLTPLQQKKLNHHTEKFCKSHSFYKPHETETHYAFPLRLLVAIVVILDFHSIFQVALGTCTWAISYHVRPFALTTVILCCSITCNATGGLLIWIGDKRTRKKDVLERMNRQELTEHAIHKVEKRRERESESEREDNDDSSRRNLTDTPGRRSFDVFRPHNSAGSSSPHGSGHAKEHKHHDKYGHLGHLGHRDKGGKEKEKGSSPLKHSDYPV